MWVGGSLSFDSKQRTHYYASRNTLYLPFVRVVVLYIKVVFSSSSCACVHFRVSNYACLFFFFFQRERERECVL